LLLAQNLTTHQHNDILVLMIPAFDQNGNLPPGEHQTIWAELEQRYAITAHRRLLLEGFRAAIEALKLAGCTQVWLDGSFITNKAVPDDFDACWSLTGIDPTLLDPVLLDFSNRRATQKAKYRGELFPKDAFATPQGSRFIDFFQVDKLTQQAKGILVLDLSTL
jgi:hypothetical protein